uniref:Uncharacterized protein n=1 Tax=Panagrolaimus superbus TaxID=310955 RepID=A0A914Y3Y8_9BILA
MRGSTSLTDLDKIRQDRPPIKFPPQQSVNKYHEKEKHDQRFFDSRGHRICFGLLHIKIGTYVFCTLVLQEIVFGLIFLLTRDEVKKGDITARIVILMLCRIIQMPPLAFLYAGLYKYKPFFLLPFALSQVTLGPFADISTFMMIVKDYEDNSYPLPFQALPWLNIVIPLFIYMMMKVFDKAMNEAREEYRKTLAERSRTTLPFTAELSRQLPAQKTLLECHGGFLAPSNGTQMLPSVASILNSQSPEELREILLKILSGNDQEMSSMPPSKRRRPESLSTSRMLQNLVMPNENDTVQSNVHGSLESHADQNLAQMVQGDIFPPSTPMAQHQAIHSRMAQTPHLQNFQQSQLQLPPQLQLPSTKTTQILQQIRQPSYLSSPPPSTSRPTRIPFPPPNLFLPPPLPQNSQNFQQIPSFPQNHLQSNPPPYTSSSSHHHPPPLTPMIPTSSPSPQQQQQQHRFPLGCCPRLPSNLSQEQQQLYYSYMLNSQRSRFPPPPPSTPAPIPIPTTNSNNNSFNENLQSGYPPHQQFPRAPLDQNEREKFNQWFSANVLRPPTPFPSPPQLLSQVAAPPQQPPPKVPSKRSRKRKRSLETYISILPRPLNVSQQSVNHNNNNVNDNRFPSLSAPNFVNLQQSNITDSRPLFSFSGPPLPDQSQGGENLNNDVSNLVTVTEVIENNVDENVDHDDVIFFEKEQEPNETGPSATCFDTPPSSKLHIADDEEEEDGNENEEQQRISIINQFLSPTIPPPTPQHQKQHQQQHQQQHEISTPTNQLLTPFSPHSSAITSDDTSDNQRILPKFDLEQLKANLDAHFSDKPMLRGYYNILKDRRPKDLPKYINTIGLAHNLQKNISKNLFEFGKFAAENLLNESKKNFRCSKCSDWDIPFSETLITYLAETQKDNLSEEMIKNALMKVIGCAQNDLSNALEKVFQLNHDNYLASKSFSRPLQPLQTKEFKNLVEKAFKAATIYEKCSIIWNHKPLKNIKVFVAEEFLRLDLITAEEKQAIIKHSECEHDWIHKPHYTRSVGNSRRLLNWN